jgi:hypothetical protein
VHPKSLKRKLETIKKNEDGITHDAAVQLTSLLAAIFPFFPFF